LYSLASERPNHSLDQRLPVVDIGGCDVGTALITGKERAVDRDDEQRVREILQRLAAHDFSDFPLLPPDPEGLTDPANMDMPDDCKRIARCARGPALRLLSIPGVVTLGLGLRTKGGKETGEFALTVLVERKLPPSEVPAGSMLPRTMIIDGDEIGVDVQEAPFQLNPRSMALAPQTSTCQPFPRRSGGCSGSSIGVLQNVFGRPEGCGGRTLAGTWMSRTGNEQRGLTCCHVALGFGIDDFLAHFPGSLLWLLESPRGAQVLASNGDQIGQDLYQLMEIDTSSWMLMPYLPALAFGVLAFIYVDGAAGPIRPQAIQPFGGAGFSFPTSAPLLPPLRGTVTGGRIGGAASPMPGTPVFKSGATTGVTFGRINQSFAPIPIPIPLPLPVQTVVIFDQIIASTSIGPGDSGSLLATTSGLQAVGQAWGGLPFQRSRLPPVTMLPNGTQLNCPITRDDIVPVTLATPCHWLSQAMNIDFG
jgi:hypothetical protein